MERLEVDRHIYDCKVLNGIAEVEIYYKKLAPGKRHAYKFECTKKLDCSIGKLAPSGLSWSFNWEKCPKFVECGKD
jgi:hypothetical protein